MSSVGALRRCNGTGWLPVCRTNAKASLTEEVSDDGHTITYSSDGTGYDNATYKLTIKIETIQYNQANSLWQ